jgi:hypothetical protein
VSTSPPGLTKDPEPPSLKRTLDNLTWSSHSLVITKPYFSFRILLGGLSKVHIPSSLEAGSGEKIVMPAAKKATRKNEMQRQEFLVIFSPPGKIIAIGVGPREIVAKNGDHSVRRG